MQQQPGTQPQICCAPSSDSVGKGAQFPSSMHRQASGQSIAKQTCLPRQHQPNQAAEPKQAMPLAQNLRRFTPSPAAVCFGIKHCEVVCHPCCHRNATNTGTQLAQTQKVFCESLTSRHRQTSGQSIAKQKCLPRRHQPNQAVEAKQAMPIAQNLRRFTPSPAAVCFGTKHCEVVCHPCWQRMQLTQELNWLRLRRCSANPSPTRTNCEKRCVFLANTSQIKAAEPKKAMPVAQTSEGSLPHQLQYASGQTIAKLCHPCFQKCNQHKNSTRSDSEGVL